MLPSTGLEQVRQVGGLAGSADESSSPRLHGLEREGRDTREHLVVARATSTATPGCGAHAAGKQTSCCNK